MGLFSNPLGYAGYPPGVQADAELVNSTVRAATAAEAAAGTLDYVYISPATQSGSQAAIFASPPPLGSTTPNTVAATTLSSTLNTTLATSASATAFGALNGVFTTGTQTASFLTGTSTGGTQVFNVLTGSSTNAGTINLGTGTAAHKLNLLSSTGLLGVFGATAVVKQTQTQLTNSITLSTGTANTLTNFTGSVYATDSSVIAGDLYQLGQSVIGIITAMKNYGMM